MALIENSKIYSGNDLENIFFRPMIAENGIADQGVRVLFNMPVPTTIHLWSASEGVLKPYESGWQGGSTSVKSAKTLEMSKVKAESAYSASEYSSKVYEHIVSRPDVNLQDLSGTDLEEAETAIFKRAIAEELRVATWIGNATSTKYDIFNGILCNVDRAYGENLKEPFRISDNVTAESVLDLLAGVWEQASDALKALKKDGHLAFYVSSDVYRAYEDFIYASSMDNNVLNCTEDYSSLFYRGIPLVDIGVTAAMLEDSGLTTSQCLLTDSRNLILALNTSDYPDAEVRMWYNPDEMENRQRAVFLAAADFIDFDLVSLGHA